MYKYCRYCMQTIDIRKHICPSKPKTKVDYKAKKENQSDKTARENRFYSSRAWQSMRLSVLIKARYKCHICERIYGEDVRKYTNSDSVHHVSYLSNCWEKRLDNNNLVPLCELHHKLVHYRKIEGWEAFNKFIEELKQEQFC